LPLFLREEKWREITNSDVTLIYEYSKTEVTKRQQYPNKSPPQVNNGKKPSLQTMTNPSFPSQKQKMAKNTLSSAK